jgi:hypothetical protein
MLACHLPGMTLPGKRRSTDHSSRLCKGDRTMERRPHFSKRLFRVCNLAYESVFKRMIGLTKIHLPAPRIARRSVRCRFP